MMPLLQHLQTRLDRLGALSRALGPGVVYCRFISMWTQFWICRTFRTDSDSGQETDIRMIEKYSFGFTVTLIELQSEYKYILTSGCRLIEPSGVLIKKTRAIPRWITCNSTPPQLNPPQLFPTTQHSTAFSRL